MGSGILTNLSNPPFPPSDCKAIVMMLMRVTIVVQGLRHCLRGQQKHTANPSVCHENRGRVCVCSIALVRPGRVSHPKPENKTIKLPSPYRGMGIHLRPSFPRRAPFSCASRLKRSRFYIFYFPIHIYFHKSPISLQV